MTLAHTHKQNIFGGTIIWNKTQNRKEIEFNNFFYYQHFLNKYTNVGDKVTVTVTNKKPKRTVLQNAFLWAYYTHIAEETGHSPDEIHEWAKGKLLPSKVVEVMGDKVRMRGSTTDLSVSDFIEFIMRIEAETGITMPPLQNYDLLAKK